MPRSKKYIFHIKNLLLLCWSCAFLRKWKGISRFANERAYGSLG